MLGCEADLLLGEHLFVARPVDAGKEMVDNMVLLLEGEIGPVDNGGGVDKVVVRLARIDEGVPHKIDDAEQDVGLEIRVDDEPKQKRRVPSG